MRDIDLPLEKRILLAQSRITSGMAPMRIPAEATDPDVVLGDCWARLWKLEAACRAALLFHAGSPWDEAKAAEWSALVFPLLGPREPDATTKTLCDALRAALAKDEAKP